MYLPIQPFLHFITTVFGDYAVVAWCIPQIQAGSDSDFVAFRQPSARRPKLRTNKFQSVTGFYKQVVFAVQCQF